VDAEGWIIDGNHRAWAAAELLNRPTIRAWVPAKQGVTEAFDQPYRTKSEKSDYGDIDMLAKLPDGTNLSIMFNNQGDDEWQVEFYRDNSQEVTGGGDAQRVFATVLTSMQKFIKKYKPWRLTFSANKDVEPGQNSESRAKLYNRLVQRYAAAWGYEEYSEDHGDQITYELTQLKPSVAENFTNNQSLKSNVVNAIRKALPMAQEIWFHGSRAIGRHRPDSDTDILVVVPDDVVGDDYIGAVRTLQKVSKQFDNYDIQPTKHSSNIYQIAQEEGQLLWSATNENFADGKIKGKSRPGRVKRAGASCDGSVTDLRARAKNASGEKARMYHWCANMKSGRKKTNEVTVGVLTLGEFTVNIDDHALDRAQERRIKSTDIDTVLKKIKLPRVIKKIMAIDLGSRFYVLDHSSNVALGFRRIGNKKLVLKTVYPGRPMDHNIATIITI
jgi:predicted nucleotidyltransferase